MPSMPPGGPVATYPSYAEAQKAVDYLSDNKFPVQYVSIVGTDLKLVERVTGRLTYGRVALAAAVSGAYIGLFVGVLFAFLEQRDFAATLTSTIAIGAGFGMIFGLVSYAMTGGRRDFTSTSQMVAAQYAVWCTPEYAGQAQQMLAGMTDAVAAGLRQAHQGGEPAGGDRAAAGAQHPGGRYPAGQQGGPWGAGPSSGSQPGTGGQAGTGGQEGAGGQAGTGGWPGSGMPGSGRPGPGRPQGAAHPGTGGQPQWQGQQPPPRPQSPPEPAQSPPEPAPAAVSGPTYSEMIARKKAEQARREAEGQSSREQEEGER
ncbi:MAG: hypothetical protein CSA58_10720 [Micrococcales bacterium]|nr:MAG: hypothetical protein CSB46_07615 [Micrococcales bacterium]PIE26202.1 MAG: hypothetical protein CSA58_10720 [Micrococcales bacterium]